MLDLHTWGPLLVSIGLMCGLVQITGRAARIARAVAASLAIVLAVRYAWWRYAMSLPDPAGQALAQTAWTWLFLITETMACLTSISMLGWMSRWRNRSAEADRAAQSPILAAPVDVLIATYNEPYDILERTIVAATRIIHDNLRVWVLDDGARPWVKQLADELGAYYVARRDNTHAKAGNINNGLAHALSTGRKPEFVLLLDADFTVSRWFLRRTLGLFEAHDVAIVQTPQHFYNADPIQAGLLCAEIWPDEQRFFFDSLMESRDAWGAAFCCGTSAVIRVKALVDIGGMATETVTEDMLTTFKLKEHGYRTIFLNEQLSMGLAPEGLQEYIKQRSRWCLGGIQQLYTRWSFAGPARVGLINRLSCVDTVGYWIFTFPFKLLLITAPLVFWWTGSSVVSAEPSDILYWLAPSAAASIIFTIGYTGNRVMPVMTDVSQLLSAVAIIGTVATGLVRPWGHPFRVTAKGRTTDSVTIQWRIALPFAALAGATLVGMLIHLTPYSQLKAMPGYSLNIIWSICSIAILALATKVCIEPPRRRLNERFATDEPAVLSLPNSRTLSCLVRDVSIGGAQLQYPIGSPEPWSNLSPGRLTFLTDGTTVRFRPVRANGGNLAVKFDDDAVSRRAMIGKLFAGGYSNEIERISMRSVLFRSVRTLFG
jgi:cellulose synthase/poly-beta-1,6-N-acetylglucosamine synthase-like glycosyltransferase